MPPARTRDLEPLQQQRAAPSTKQKKPISSAQAFLGANKDNASNASSNTAAGGQAQPVGMAWSSERGDVLNAYRAAYHLDTPGCFHSTLSAAALAALGIGRRSPTMARKRANRKVPKEQLAVAVRRHFNDMAVSENEVITEFMYSVTMQDRKFKAKFAPSKR